MALQRVSFAKPVVAQPRLSEKYVPGRHSMRYWTDAELKILTDHFEKEGAKFCQIRLPGRSVGAICQAAYKNGLKGGPSEYQALRANFRTPEMDARIREEWESLSGNNSTGEVKALAEKLGVPRWWLSKRATKLGLAVPRMSKEPAWSAAELDLIKRVPLHDPGKCAVIFRDHGFHRTPTSIVVKSKRVGLSRRYTDTLSATSAAKILGVDAKNFTHWIAKGLVKATKRETNRLPQQGGHPWSIDRKDFRQFIIDHLEQIDFRKVDKFSIVALLTETQ